jgi:type I restriction enzyme, S subunit
MEQVCELVTDGTHDSPRLQKEGVPFIKGKHISGGTIDFSICDFISETDHEEACKRVKPQRGDILFSNIGSVGDTAVVKDDREFSIKNVALFRPDRRKVDQNYFYYLVLSSEFRSNVMNVRSGSAQPFISLANLRSFEVTYHEDHNVQRRIAGILSAYDELIENNQRRIKILEEMARSLYREWFVHFRFPGHDKVKMVPSPLGPIPQGWEVKKLGEVLELNYGKALKSDTRREGQIPVFGSSGIVGCHDTSLVKGPGIIVGRKGNVGSVFWSDADFYPIDTAYFVTSSLPLRFMFYELQTKNFINNDAAVPGLSRHQAYSLETVIPPTDLLTRFCRLANDFEHQASKLRRQI